MQFLKKFNFLQLIFILNILFPASISQEITHCGTTAIQSPYLNQITVCKSDQLYFRTSIGLFQISSIDHANKLFTVSHPTSSPSSSYISPNHLSAGFPPISSPNSLILFNCSNRSSKASFFSCNDSELTKGYTSCSIVDDVGKIGESFDPREMNCTHYWRVYRRLGGFELGTRVSFDVPDHVPNPCDQCEKRDGNCGAGLRCLCHPKLCKDKVISVGSILKPFGNRIFYMVLFITVMGFF